ncbi:hypothetical protein OMP40_21655 [Cohnella rhizosphaerae]|uniref:Spore germination protein N-terminal domain-containing protein n=1 Tax=Cohnella rhizosphaerae TaxID=1457232 RepID=A0A9X4KVX9_9BACL|nr:hypothetical protein [Cohnella rhizosphaerae]MDG0811683.1 hypothetical protein [Cohnella rhizosphaerae]
MSRFPLAALAASLLVLPLSGCWSKVELNDRSFITSAYIDLGEGPDEIVLTIDSPLPNRMGAIGNTDTAPQRGRSYTSNTAAGATIPEALDKIQNDLTRQLTWGQTRAVVVSADFAAQRGTEGRAGMGVAQPLFPVSNVRVRVRRSSQGSHGSDAGLRESAVRSAAQVRQPQVRRTSDDQGLGRA